MSWAIPTTSVQMEFSGVGGGWTDVTTDVISTQSIIQDYGIKSNRPEDRCAPAGNLSFGLRNDAQNSGGVQGYYSLESANRRAGFILGIRVRVFQVFNDLALEPVSKFFMCRLDQAIVMPGIFEDQMVSCVCVDWMDEPARTNASPGRALLSNCRSDEVFSGVLAGIPTQPAATSIAVGADTYDLALDNIGQNEKALSVFADLARSELGYIYCRRDLSFGQTLVFESRHTRILLAASHGIFASLDDDMHGLDLPGSRTDVLNRFLVTCHPKITVGYTSIVVAKLDSPFRTALGPGDSVTLFLDYTDPTQRDTKIGARNQVTPLISGTDYTMNSAVDGSGVNLTANFTVTPTFFASACKLVVTNSGPDAAFILTLQVRGDGILSLNPVDMEAKDDTSIRAYGENLVELNMRFQQDPNVAAGIGAYLVYLSKDPFSNIRSVRFVANQSAALLYYGLYGDISDTVEVIETVSGISALYHINSVMIETEEFERVTVEWFLTRADKSSQYWLLGVAGASELGDTTQLGFV